jgi:hypothetical protein
MESIIHYDDHKIPPLNPYLGKGLYSLGQARPGLSELRILVRLVPISRMTLNYPSSVLSYDALSF